MNDKKRYKRYFLIVDNKCVAKGNTRYYMVRKYAKIWKEKGYQCNVRLYDDQEGIDI